ncbi:MAG TPA: hypothetical protein VEL10_10280 [Gaiellaceae bacterium]|nr:hypothetical protein [Gaiellaceae bacterium]
MNTLGWTLAPVFSSMISPPDLGEGDGCARQHLARVAQEELEQAELDRRELDRSSGATNRAGFGIEHEIAEPEGVRATPGTGPHEALRAGHHFLPAGARSAPGFSSPATTADPLLPPIIRLTRRA